MLDLVIYVQAQIRDFTYIWKMSSDEYADPVKREHDDRQAEPKNRYFGDRTHVCTLHRVGWQSKCQEGVSDRMPEAHPSYRSLGSVFTMHSVLSQSQPINTPLFQ